jgi:sigma-B regulation protein RsbU (phosphoserine phosphatase)
MSALFSTAPPLDHARDDRAERRTAAINRLAAVTESTLTPGQIRSRHLERLSVATSGAEDRFERITSLASSLFAMPMCTVTLMDADSAMFPGHHGFGAAPPIPRELVFCDRTIAAGEPLIVEDATADPRFAQLPIVTGAPYLRFYAGVPLDDDEGVTVGTFCLFDTVPRRLDRTQLSMLMQLASWARRELVDSTEMARAREVQQALLPTRTVAPAGYELAAMCSPTKGVGGDFFDHGMVRGQLVFALMDVMGKGVGAALVAASVRALLRASVAHQNELRLLDGSGLRNVVSATDRLLHADLEQTGTLVTGFLATLDPVSGQLDWVDAGHGLAVIIGRDGSSRRLAGTDLPLGLGVGSDWVEHSSVIAPGETLLVASDGLFDLLGGTPEALDRISDLVRAEPSPSRLIDSIADLTSIGTALDDVTAVAIRRNVAGASA